MNKTIFSPKLPLETDINENFVYNTDILTAVKQNIRMLILTNPGEKISDPEFGVGISRYLFNPQNGIVPNNFSLDEPSELQDIPGDITYKITNQAKKYIPDISIEEIVVTDEENKINILIKYNYKEYVSDSVILSVGQ